jgi:dUTP pyrophosphatase
MIVRFSVGPKGTPPLRKSQDAAGYDIFSAEDAVIGRGEVTIVDTDLKVEFPRNLVLQVWSRSGLAAKHGVFVLNSPGIIDSDYRGTIKIILTKATFGLYEVKKGDRIAQVGLLPLADAAVFHVDPEDLSDTERGSGGLGSTGT